jgi:hypothetical protein
MLHMDHSFVSLEMHAIDCNDCRCSKLFNKYHRVTLVATEYLILLYVIHRDISCHSWRYRYCNTEYSHILQSRVLLDSAMDKH